MSRPLAARRSIRLRRVRDRLPRNKNYSCLNSNSGAYTTVPAELTIANEDVPSPIAQGHPPHVHGILSQPHAGGDWTQRKRRAPSISRRVCGQGPRGALRALSSGSLSARGREKTVCTEHGASDRGQRAGRGRPG